jgi:hypothetical protein
MYQYSQYLQRKRPRQLVRYRTRPFYDNRCKRMSTGQYFRHHYRLRRGLCPEAIH